MSDNPLVGKTNDWEPSEEDMIAYVQVKKFLNDNMIHKGKPVHWIASEIAEATKLDIGLVKTALEAGVSIAEFERKLFKQGKRKVPGYKQLPSMTANKTPTEAIREPKARVEDQSTGWERHE